jgi:hypothetical protein
MNGKQNLVILMGVGLILWQFFRGWQKDALFHGSWAA